MKLYCALCDEAFDEYEIVCRHLKLAPFSGTAIKERWNNEIKKEQQMKMTREEAIKTFQAKMYTDAENKRSPDRNRRWAEHAIETYEALGLLKFDEVEKNQNQNQIEIIIELINNSIDGNVRWNKLDVVGRIVDAYGIIRLEEWPEGLVLWVGGQIVYKSWEGKDKPKAEDEKADNTNYIKMAKNYVDASRFSQHWGSSAHIIQGLLNIIEGHVKPNVDNWTVSKGDMIHVTFEGWNGNNPQYDGRVVRIEKS